MKMCSARILLLVVAGCAPSHPLIDDSGAPLPDASGDDSTVIDGAAADCGPPEPYTPCRTDADCGNPYLVCAPPGSTTITVCRDPGQDPVINPACPSFAILAAAPLCPAQANVTSTVCDIRYQRPCTVDADCGPAGFMCQDEQCQWTSTTCTTAADCPTGWDCYVSCPCPGIRDTPTCMPPFAFSSCGACSTGP